MFFILRAFILGFYPFLKVNGFLIDVSTLPPGTCDVERVLVCSNNTIMQSLYNVTTNGIHINSETMYNLQCSDEFRENYTQVYIQCIKNHADPRCPPNSETATFLKAVSNVTNGTNGMDSIINSLCRNKTSYTNYVKCVTLLPNVRPYPDCFMGKTLNTTFDVKEPCNFFLMNFGCLFKYIDMMCPDSLKYVIESAAKYANDYNCSLDLPSSAPAQSCDLNMQLGCHVAFDKPNISDTQAMFQFYCSDRFPGYKECIRKVAKLCKSVDLSTLLTQTSENQLAVMCNDKTGFEEFQTCFLKYGKNTEFISCLTGNGTMQDNCSLLKASYTCNKDFIQRTCPTVLQLYQTFSFYDDGDCHVGIMPMLTSVGDRVGMDRTLTITTFTVFAVLSLFA